VQKYLILEDGDRNVQQEGFLNYTVQKEELFLNGEIPTHSNFIGYLDRFAILFEDKYDIFSSSLITNIPQLEGVGYSLIEFSQSLRSSDLIDQMNPGNIAAYLNKHGLYPINMYGGVNIVKGYKDASLLPTRLEVHKYAKKEIVRPIIFCGTYYDFGPDGKWFPYVTTDPYDEKRKIFSFVQADSRCGAKEFLYLVAIPKINPIKK